jgi:hypothetical protein
MIQSNDEEDEHDEPVEEIQQENVNEHKFVPSCIHIQKSLFFKQEACCDSVMMIQDLAQYAQKLKKEE